MKYSKLFESELPKGITFEDPQEAFQEAIDKGRLSLNPESVNYVHDFMYMLTKDGVPQFKSKTTRQYLE